MLSCKLSRYQWQQSDCGTVRLTGTYLLQGQPQTANQLAALLAQSDLSQMASLFAKSSGYYSLIAQFGQQIYLCTDFVRSYPLFYVQRHQQLWVADDAAQLFEWLYPAGTPLSRQQVIPELDKPSAVAEEFVAVGYVCGDDTLYPGVKQLPVATIIQAQPGELTQRRYFTWQRKPLTNLTEAELIAALDHHLTAALQEAVKIADGRQIVVPLSGGYDSRAILLYLTKLGYQDIVTFTFGRKNSKELQLAGQLASQLKVKWIPVIYTAKMWLALRHDAQFAQYCRFICNGVSAVNTQVWPAIRHLLQHQLIAKDALILPGHTGDFISGLHLCGDDRTVNQADLAFVADSILQQHYRLDKLEPTSSVRQRLLLQCQAIYGEATDWTVENLRESWNWRERQAKFIVNSNRYYEFFALDWWMPLWQKDFVVFWQTVPTPYLRQQKLWRQLIRQQCEMQGVSVPDKNAGKASGLLHRSKLVLNYFFDANLLLWLVPFHLWLLYRLGLLKHSGTVNSYLVRRLLAWFKQDAAQALHQVEL